MTRVGETARKRAREGLPPAKPGRTSWVHGSKVAFMDGFKDDYLKAAELGKVHAGRFYDDVSDAYLKKYGYKLAFTDDLPEGEDVAEDVDEDEDVNTLSPEEALARSAHFDELRSKVGYWFRGRYGGSVQVSGKKNKPTNFKTVFNQKSLDPPAPVRARITDFYSRRCYSERIKPRFEARWAVVSKQDPCPAAVMVRNAVTKEDWEAESIPFQDEMKAALEAEHAAALAAYKSVVRGEAPTTPEEYQLALNNAGFYLQPFVDAAAERFGMNVSLLMCGPTPDRGGAIEVHSVHAGVSSGLVPRIWPDFDRGGFEATRRSFREFSDHCFLKTGGREAWAECWSYHTRTTWRRAGMAGGGSGDEEGDDDKEDDEEDRGQDLAVAMCPELAGEVERMEPGARESFKRRVKWRMSDFELGRENNMARNRQLFRDAGLMGAVQSETSRAAAAGDAEEALKKKRGRKVKETPDASAPKRRSLRGGGAENQRGEEEERGASRPRPTAAYRGAGVNVPLIRPEENPTSFGPFLPDFPPVDMGATPLVRPEEDPTSFGPFLPVDVGATLLVRPEEDPTSFGPHLPVAVGATPLAGAEEDPTLSKTNGTSAADESGGGGEDGELVWGGKGDVESWSPELRHAVKGLIRLKTWAGADWVECVEKMIGLERAWSFKDKGLLSAPTEGKGGRPKVVKEWMRYARKWEGKVELLTREVGPRGVAGSFAAQWWAWWGGIQPAGREVLADGALTRPDLDGNKWAIVGKTSGRNGILLFVGCLLWWGEAVAEAGDASLTADWKDAVSDVCWVLSEGLYLISFDGVNSVDKAEKDAAANAKKLKAKAGENGGKRKGAEKENEVEEPPRKRKRRV
ncbi:hypothetical protein C8F04DRAFT_1252282 [Mycena alexandri]|uniref:Uncharacterized protein n=1 Tax=Mycena alexandri TaxID=1745969 RepID=A0AAD6TBG1_9AGAR|nr:hypothetical protein C8F04DRAFT_1252282 [Mycena alexandri]